MNTMLASMLPTQLLLLLLLMGVFVLMTSAGLNSAKVVSYRKSRTTQNGLVRCALHKANETSSSSSLKVCSLNCMRDDTCTGFNIKNSATCDVYSYNPTTSAPVSDCTFYQVSVFSNLRVKPI